jgi:hypothetical protein
MAMRMRDGEGQDVCGGLALVYLLGHDPHPPWENAAGLGLLSQVPGPIQQLLALCSSP